MSKLDLTRHLSSLHKTNETLSLALEAAKMGAWEWDLETGTIYWSDGMYELLGYPKDQTAPSEEAWWRRIHPEDVPVIEGWMPEVLSRPTEFRNEFRIVRPVEDVLWVESRGRSKANESGKIVCLLGVLVDVNQKKMLEEQLRRERERQKELSQTISHDLRSPLTDILGHAQLALARETDDQDVRLSLEAIDKSAGLMNRMIQDLTDLTKIESGQLAPEKEPIHLAPFLEDLLSRLRMVMTVERVRMMVPPELPPVDADPSLLERIVGNLVSNALKYSPEDRPVLIRVRAGEDEVVTSVIDQGAGISPKDVPSVFHRFFRGQKKSGIEGLGLGLFITKMLVKAHGGRLWVSSREGRGSVFSFSLPVCH